MSVPLNQLALQQEDLYEGIQMVEMPELSNTIMYMVMNSIRESEEVSQDYRDTSINYFQTLLDLGFMYQRSIISQEMDYQQDILLFFTPDEAERAVPRLPRMSADMVLVLFKELGAEIESEISVINTSELGPDSRGVAYTLSIGNEKRYANIIVTRERNIISAITLTSHIMSSSPYSALTPDDTLSLSKKAIDKIQSQLGGRDLLVPAPESTRFPDLLKLVPAALVEENENFMVMNDYALIRELFDAAIPDTFSDKAIEEYMMSMYGYGDDFDYTSGMAEGSFIGGHGRVSKSAPEQLENIGFNLLNVDADIYTGYTANYTHSHAALTGRFDPVVTRDAMGNQQEWPVAVRDSFTFEDYLGTTIYSWGNGDFGEENRMKPPILDRIGRALPLAVTPANVFYAETTENIKMMIDASKGAASSLADVPEYYAAVEGLAGLGTYSCIIGGESFVNGADFQRDESEAPLLKPYLTFGTGIGRDILGPYMALVLVHDSAAAATANAEILVERVNNTSWIAPVDWVNFWRLYVDYIQVNAEGNVLSAKLYGDRSQYLWERWIYEYNPFLLHE